MEIDDGFVSGVGFEDGEVLRIVHKKIFSEDCRTKCMTENVEVFLNVRVSIDVVRSEPVAGQKVFCRFVQAGG